MNDVARQKLVKLMDTQPPTLLEDSERFEAFLRDYCGECKPEISAILAALAEDIPRDLRRMRSQPYPLLREQLANRLQDERSLHQEAALWAVESWAVALEIAPGSQRQHGAGGSAAYENGGGTYVVPPQAASPFPSQQRTPVPIVSPGYAAPGVVSPPTILPEGPPVVVYPRNTPVGSGAPMQPMSQTPAWQKGWTPVTGAPQAMPAPPQHNSFLVGGICAAVAIFIGLLVNSASSGEGTFGGVLAVIFALAAVVELALGAVRNYMGKPQPPDFVTSSLEFWMKMFAMEDRVLGIFASKHGAQVPASAPQQYPAPTPPAVFTQTPSTPASAPQQPAASGQSPQKTDPAAGNIFCIACGTTNGPGAIFCLSCGERLYYPEAPKDPPAN
ncbi:MAG TPA: hypothetical protein VLV89_04905 [Candidatus Acidoferrum sp.]|nr:hypothetical protein [Candidatus Acidoferrum sp.]